MTFRAEPAFVEIVERVPAGHDVDKITGGYIKPNEVRINGIPLACPRDHTIQVHEIDLGADDVVQVTLTLFARRVLIGGESADEVPGGDGSR